MSTARRGGQLATAWLALALLTPAASLGQDAEKPGTEQPEPGSGAPMQRGACHADVQRLCSDAKGVPGGVGACLREHEDELSEPCREQISRLGRHLRGAGARIREQCSEDIGRLCSDIGPGQRGVVRCLRSHEADLSDGCREALPSRARRGGPGGGGPGGGRRGPP